MRHSTSLLASMEGISRTTFLLAKELSQNSRSGLTPRFLARKLEVPVEEVEYLVDVHHRLFFTDLTKIKLAPEGFSAIKRVLEGLESHGDAPWLINHIKMLPPHDLQRLEERLGLERSLPKKELADLVLSQCYGHPDSLPDYVASRNFSDMAREVFDHLWQSRDGLMSLSQLYVACGGREFEVEKALWELVRGCACFELFRFDANDRLVRAAALLKELRDYRKAAGRSAGASYRLKPLKSRVDSIHCAGLSLSEVLCRLVAVIAARPVRLRGDGELFREDRRRLEEIRRDGDEPSLNTCLWIAEGIGWLVRVDNTLTTGELDDVLQMSRIERHEIVATWMMQHAMEPSIRDLLYQYGEDLRSETWYRITDYITCMKLSMDQSTPPVLRSMGAHYEYLSPSANTRMDIHLARVLEETLFWLGLVDRGYCEGEACFRLSPVGEAVLFDRNREALEHLYPVQTGAFVVQPNYEIVVPIQDMDPLLTAPLDQFAARISSGSVCVYHLTRESFVRALQEGRSGEQFVAFLLNHNRGPLPENVLYTLKDWSGTIKQVRLRTYHVVESDDPLVIAELQNHKDFRGRLEAVESRKMLKYQDMARSEIKRLLEKDGFIVQ